MNRDDIIRMAREAGIVWNDHTVVGSSENLLECFANLVAAAEREKDTALLRQALEALETCVCAMQDYQAGIGITEMFDKGERKGRLTLPALRARLEGEK